MLQTSNKLIDCISYNNIKRLISFSIIVSSTCLGWCLSAGINQWRKTQGRNQSDYYFRCDMLPNGSYPAFGTY